jgi:hypothetical protein
MLIRILARVKNRKRICRGMMSSRRGEMLLRMAKGVPSLAKLPVHMRCKTQVEIQLQIRPILALLGRSPHLTMR